MIELDISWDGSAPGLAEHRLSVAGFAIPLRSLLMAARRTANNMLREAVDRKESDKGRLAADADRIDIQIVSISDGSVSPSCIIAVAPAFEAQIPMWPEALAEDAIDRLLGDLEYESRGVHRNKSVREYFRQLPAGITKQDYVLRVDGAVRREVHIGTVSLALESSDSPYLTEITGSVIGVGFDPGKHFVKIKSADSTASESTLSATREQVDAALENRERQIRVLVLNYPGGARLLKLQPSSDRKVKLDTNSYVFHKWNDLLARLAQ